MKSLLKQIGIVIALSLLAAGSGSSMVEKDEPEASKNGKRCVRLSQIRELDIIDDQTILFHMAGDKTYRNRLPQPCPNLNAEDAISYSTSLNRLCSVDIIKVLRSGSRCGLGVFEPDYQPQPAGGARDDADLET